jgi:predicted DNA-binding transcriptional regulator YafY
VPSFYVALTILDRLLSTPGRILAQHLTADLEDIVPRVQRSIQRYIQRFEALGLRVEKTTGGRGIHVSSAFRQQLHVLHFTTDELAALYFHLALLGDMVQGNGLQGHLATACQKIGLGVGELYNLDTLQHAFLPFQKWYKTYSSRALQTKLTLIIHALQEARVCQVRYRLPQADRVWTFAMQPYALFAYEGGLYLFAYLPDTDRVITLGVERIRYITVDEKTFTRLPRICQHIASKRERAFGILDDEQELDVVLTFSAAQAPYIRERVWHPSQHLEAQADGSLILRFRASGRFEMVRWILGWGEEVEVVEPLDLRQEIAQCLQEAARQYQG